jgi:hypothetical protein
MPRGDRLFALCLGAILVFCTQSTFCFFEHAGFIRCPVNFEQHQSTTDSESQNNGQACDEQSHSAVVAKSAGVPMGRLVDKISLKSDKAADGSIREIDHPPQLS